MTAPTDPAEARWLARLLAMQVALRDHLRDAMVGRGLEERAAAVRDDAQGDTIFAIDVDAEAVLLEHCAAWAGEGERFVLVAEGIEPASGRAFGEGPPEWRVIADPIDGSRGLMFDKRSAWCLTAVAPEAGAATTLRTVRVAAMTELPTSRMHRVDTLATCASGGLQAWREDLCTGERFAFTPRPSTATDLRHGYASVACYFPGGKELLARVDEAIATAALGGWNPEKCEVYTDQYISSAGQLAELVLGRDRFVLDVRPLVHRALGVPSSLCSRPYDLCTESVARAAGCVVTAPDGTPLDAPLDLVSDVAFVGHANAGLARVLQPLVETALRENLLLD